MIGVAQDELLARLASRPRLEKTPTCVGFPKGGPQAPEHVWIDGAVPQDWTIEYSTTGAEGIAPQDEEVDLVVNFLVTRHVDTFVEVRDATIEIANELLTILRTDRTLGGIAQHAHCTGGALDEGYYPDGKRQCHIELHVHVSLYLDATTVLG